MINLKCLEGGGILATFFFECISIWLDMAIRNSPKEIDLISLARRDRPISLMVASRHLSNSLRSARHHKLHLKYRQLNFPSKAFPFSKLVIEKKFGHWKDCLSSTRRNYLVTNYSV